MEILINALWTLAFLAWLFTWAACFVMAADGAAQNIKPRVVAAIVGAVVFSLGVSVIVTGR